MGHHLGDREQQRIPTPARHVVARPRIERMLDEGLDYPVTLICAPAGSGKSVLAGAWARRRARHHVVAWLRCSALADTPAAFWSAATTALQQAIDDRSDGRLLAPLALFRRATIPGDRSELLDELLSWLAELPAGSTLLCDDFDEVRAAATQRDVQYVIDRLPTALNLIIISRSYPPLAVHKARLEGRLIDIRAGDLAFSAEETRELMSVHGLDVDSGDVDLLQMRTEGWAAGLRLAVTAMVQTGDRVGVIRRLAGSSEAVSGYLTEQVLSQLPAGDRDLLLQTCVVDDLTESLVEALTGVPGRLTEIEHISDRVGFLSRTDDGPDPTFRYHPMFAELLRNELRHADPHRFAGQHRRAANWYARRQEASEAIRHAQLGGDWDLAVRTLALNAVAFVVRGRGLELKTLLGGFPSDLVAEDPRLALTNAIPVVFGNDPDRAQVLLDRARTGLPSDGSLEARRLSAAADYVSTLIARYRGDASAALSALSPDGPNVPGPDDSGFTLADLDLRAVWRSTRAASLMWDDQTQQALVEAHLAASDVRLGAAKWPMITSLGVRAWLLCLDGELTAASRVIEEVSGYLSLRDWDEAPYATLADFSSAWIAMERARFTEAEAALARAEARWRRVSSGAAGATLRMLRARLRLIDGSPGPAADLLEHAFDDAPQASSRLLERLETRIRVEVLITGGRLAEAADVARSGSPALQTYVNARSGGDPEPLDVASPGEDQGLRVRTLLAWADQAQRRRRPDQADRYLDAALDLTEAEGFRLPFLQLGERAHALLLDARVAAARHRSLLAALLSSTAASNGRGADLVDPLSPRELDVLRHLVAGMETDEIAGDLFVSRHTVRTHTKSIYRKLSVQNKRDAVLRAAALGLV